MGVHDVMVVKMELYGHKFEPEFLLNLLNFLVKIVCFAHCTCYTRFSLNTLIMPA